MKFSKRSKERMWGVDSRLVDVMNHAITITKVDFGIPLYGGLRTVEDQEVLFEDGKSLADGTSNRSRHQEGLAVDVFAYVDGVATWEEEYLAKVACAVLQSAAKLGYKVKWGGLFRSFKDMPHFELYE